jgi:hypothetical protein
VRRRIHAQSVRVYFQQHRQLTNFEWLYVRACVRACACVRVCVCVHACVHTCSCFFSHNPFARVTSLGYETVMEGKSSPLHEF